MIIASVRRLCKSDLQLSFGTGGGGPRRGGDIPL